MNCYETILLITEGEEIISYLTYGSFLHETSSIEATTCHSFIIMNENMFMEARKVWDKEPWRDYLLVVNEKKEPLYFCFQINNPAICQCEDMMNSLEKYCDYITLQVCIPSAMAVEIYGFNELAYRFYKWCKKNEIPVCVYGRKWELVLRKEYTLGFSNGKEYPEFQICRMYSESPTYMGCERDRVKMDDLGIYEIISRLSAKLYTKKQMSCYKMWKKYGNNTYMVKFPSRDDLKEVSIEDDIYEKILSAPPSKYYINEKTKDYYRRAMGEEQWNYYERTGEVKDYEYKEILTSKYPERKRCYLIGPCIVVGFTLWKDSLVRLIQERFQRNYYNEYEVIPVCIATQNVSEIDEMMKKLTICDNDIFIFFILELILEEKVDIDLANLFDRRSKNERWFYDMPIHTTAAGNKAVAQEVMHHILKDFEGKEIPTKRGRIVQLGRKLSGQEETELTVYLEHVKKEADITGEENTGCIVMNCNPFTKGHRYLIEYAADRVEKLIVFVVEEDRSEFKFQDRFEMVKMGTADLKNVVVLPSGKFILSSTTFEPYFNKAHYQ